MELWLGTNSSMMLKVEKYVYITAAANKIPCFSFFPRSRSGNTLRIQHRSSHGAPCPAYSATLAPTDQRNPSCLAPFWLLGVWLPSNHPAPYWLLDALLVPRVSSWLPVPSRALCTPWSPLLLLVVQQPSFCSVSSKPLGSLQNTQHPPGSPSNALLATRRPPGYPALSWLFGAVLTARAPSCCSMYWPLNVILAVKC